MPHTTKTSTCKVHCVDHFYLTPFTGRSSIYSEITTMSIIEIVSLACLFILFSMMFFVVKNHLVLMQLWRQRAERDGAMMDVQDRENPTLDTPLQPRVGEMAPIGMHVIPYQRGVLDYSVWLWSQVHFSIKELQIAHFLEKTMNNSFQKR